MTDESGRGLVLWVHAEEFCGENFEERRLG
jgi:hypothetical protein